jgi:4-hydroxy-2-oxoheptanedioate aldolase
MSAFFTQFAERLRSGEPAFAAFIGFSEALVTENLMRDGFDSAIIDMQHGLHDAASAIAAVMAAAAAGKPVFVRPPVGDFATASRMLDAGAVGIVAPMINSVADARAFAAACKFPPLGERSWGPYRATAVAGQEPGVYLKRANDETLALAMIETQAALDSLDDILAVPGIDGAFVGPSDLSIALTRGETVDSFHPKVDAALDHVVARCQAHGKVATCFAMTGKRAGEMIARGFKMCSIATDQVLLRQAARAEIAAARAVLAS